MVKGNIIVTEREQHGIILAMRKDGTRAKVYIYGPDREDWLPVEWLTVEVSGIATCWKCGGSGQYHSGGGTVNGKFTGTIGECFACHGKGKQNDDDRTRCHYYWHRQSEIEAGVEAAERGEEPKPLSIPWMQPDASVTDVTVAPKPAVKPARPTIRSKKREFPHNAAVVSETDDGSRLIDCKGCGCVHRDDTMCPW